MNSLDCCSWIVCFHRNSTLQNEIHRQLDQHLARTGTIKNSIGIRVSLRKRRTYWTDTGCFSPSPSYVTVSNTRRFNSFDLESADELGILLERKRAANQQINQTSKENSLPMILNSISTSIHEDSSLMNGLFRYALLQWQMLLWSPNTALLLRTDSFFLHEINLLHYLDSGLSLTAARDATEVESEYDTKSNRTFDSTDKRKQRAFLRQRNGDEDTDSDEVFIDVNSSLVSFMIYLIPMRIFFSDSPATR